MNRVLVIVVTYNGLRWLERCLGSVTGADLYVVDNDSTDGSADYVQAHFPAARLVRCAENMGFSKANNLGIRYALERGYDYVYLLNQDAWLEEGALGALVAAAEAHPEYAVLSPLQLQADGRTPDRLFARLYSGGSGLTPVRRVMAAHWLVRMGAVRKVGLFNEDLLPLYGQDDDWCNRARYHGFRIGVVPAARAVHDRAFRQEAKEKVIWRNYYMGSLVRLCDINRPLWERFLFTCLFTLVKAAKYGSILPFRHFRTLCRRLPEVRAARLAARNAPLRRG